MIIVTVSVTSCCTLLIAVDDLLPFLDLVLHVHLWVILCNCLASFLFVHFGISAACGWDRCNLIAQITETLEVETSH